MSFIDLFTPGLSRPNLHQRPSPARIYGALTLLFAFTLLTALQQGEIKAYSSIEWGDVIGEGLTCVAAVAWLHFVIAWRPPGPVTRWLSMGFMLLSYSFYLDWIDEFVRFEQSFLGQSGESLLAPLAIALLTIGAFSLHREQRAMRRQHLRREANYRDHQCIDPVTDLYNANYCRQALDSAIEEGTAPTLWLVDLQDFNRINRQHGFAMGDAVLNRVANTLVASVPDDSLVCRYAGDRFAVLTREPLESRELEPVLGELLTSAIRLALMNCGEAQIDCRVRVAMVYTGGGDSAVELFERASAQIRAKKS